MKIKIEKRYSSDTLLEGEAESLKEFVVKNKSNLSGSNLSGSDLSGSRFWQTKIKASQKDVFLEALGVIIVQD